LRGKNQREASTICSSISTVSTLVRRGLASSVWVVSPDPNPMQAAVRASGCSVIGTRPSRIIVGSSSDEGWVRGLLMAASTLPLVLTRPWSLSLAMRLTVAVLPSR